MKKLTVGMILAFVFILACDPGDTSEEQATAEQPLVEEAAAAEEAPAEAGAAVAQAPAEDEHGGCAGGCEGCAEGCEGCEKAAGEGCAEGCEGCEGCAKGDEHAEKAADDEPMGCGHDH